MEYKTLIAQEKKHRCCFPCRDRVCDIHKICIQDIERVVVELLIF